MQPIVRAVISGVIMTRPVVTERAHARPSHANARLTISASVVTSAVGRF